MDKSFREYYVNDLRTTTCSGVLGHRTLATALRRLSAYLFLDTGIP